MITNFAFNLGAIISSSEGVNNGWTIPREVNAIMDKYFGDCKDYLDGNVVINFAEGTDEGPGSASMFIDMPKCYDLPDVMLRFQKALIEFMQRGILATTSSTQGTIILPHQGGAIG